MDGDSVTMWDVIVIGGGPAGCAAALSAKKRGAGSVLILERERMPREKICAGGITPWAVSALRECGFPDHVLQDMYPVSTVRVLTGRGAAFVTNQMLNAGVVRRSILDHYLARSAVKQGVVLLEGVTVTELILENNRAAGVNTDAGSYRSRYVIVANGGTSRLHRDERKRNYTAAILSRFDGIPHKTQTIQLVFDRRIEPFYGWLFPESEDSFNVGIAATAEVLHRDSLEQVFQRIIDEHFGEMINGKDPVFTGSSTILADPCFRHRCFPGSLLAGEAARLVHPFFGEGISCALHSGRLAGEAVAEGLREGLSESRIEAMYLKNVQSRLGRYLKRSLFLQNHGIQLLNATRLLVKIRPVRDLVLRSLGCP